jgi:DNA adenine methylase
VNFGFEQYQEIAEIMRKCEEKMMISISDYPDIQQVFDDFHMLDHDIKYAMANNHGDVPASKELVILNWEPEALGGLF